MRRAPSLVLGLGAVAAGVALAAHLGYFFVHSELTGARLLRHERSAISTGACTAAALRNPAGIVEAPRIGLQAPVVAGVGGAQLAVAVGYLPTSSLPGRPGTTVLAAHDVTWFSGIDRLRPGEQVRYLTRCATYVYTAGAHRVVESGTEVLSGGPSELLLETCWPLSSLYLTRERYLVEARLTAVLPPARTAALPRQAPQPLAVPVPAAESAAGFPGVLDAAPLGQLVVVGTPAASWSQSAAPLQAEHAALRLYFAALAAARGNQPAWWHALAPGVPLGAAGPLLAARITHYDRGLTPTLGVVGDTVTSVAFDTRLRLSGGSSPGTYQLHATGAVRQGVLTLTGLTLTGLVLQAG